MEQKQITYLLIGLALIIALIGSYFGVKLPAPEIPPAGVRGTIERAGLIDVSGDGIQTWNGGTFAAYSDAGATAVWTVTTAGNMTAGSNVIFEGATADAYETTVTVTDPTADRTITLPNATGTVALISGATRLVVGSNTITGTLNVTHGLTTPLYALCTLGQDPVATEESSCTTVVSGSTVTVKVWKTTQAAGDSGVTVFWLVAGTP